MIVMGMIVMGTAPGYGCLFSWQFFAIFLVGQGKRPFVMRD